MGLRSLKCGRKLAGYYWARPECQCQYVAEQAAFKLPQKLKVVSYAYVRAP